MDFITANWQTIALVIGAFVAWKFPALKPLIDAFFKTNTDPLLQSATPIDLFKAWQVLDAHAKACGDAKSIAASRELLLCIAEDHTHAPK